MEASNCDSDMNHNAWVKHLELHSDRVTGDCCADAGFEVWESSYLRRLLLGDDTIIPASADVSAEYLNNNAIGPVVMPTLERIQTQTSISAAKVESTRDDVVLAVPRFYQDRTRGLFMCPVEVRQLVYFHIFRPDCGMISEGYCWLGRYEHHYCMEDFAGCASFLATCSQIYNEAKAFLDNGEPFVTIRGQRRSLFRSERDNGRPGHLSGSKPMTRIYTPPKWSELQICRIRRLFYYEGGHGPRGASSESHLKEFAREISQLAGALNKNNHIEAVRVLFCRSINNGDSRFGYTSANPSPRATEYAGVRKAIMPLIQFALERGVKICAEPADRNRPVYIEYSSEIIQFEDPLVNWFNNAMIPFSLRALDLNPYGWDAHSEIKQLEAEHELESAKMAAFSLASAFSYKLFPECRKCYANFATEKELEIHLAKNPKHAISFVAKFWNKLSPRARSGAARSCPTCGLGFNYAPYLEDHLRKSKHSRSTAIPRYACDNKWTERVHAERAKKAHARRYPAMYGAGGYDSGCAG